jgi:hypothetical protein
MRIDLLRPTVVSDLNQLVTPVGWNITRRMISLHRCPQSIYAIDVAAAVKHLLEHGWRDGSPSIGSYNICDEACGTYRDLFNRARQLSPEIGFIPPFDLPKNVEFAKDLLKYRSSEFVTPWACSSSRTASSEKLALIFRWATIWRSPER